MAGSREDYNAAQHRQERRVRAESYGTENKTPAKCCFVVFALVCPIHLTDTSDFLKVVIWSLTL